MLKRAALVVGHPVLGNLLKLLILVAISGLLWVYFVNGPTIAIKAHDPSDFSRTDFVTIVLSALSVLLAALGLGLAGLAVWGYSALRDSANRTAEATAREVAQRVGASAADEAMQRIKTEVMSQGTVDDTLATAMSSGGTDGGQIGPSK